MKSVSAIAIRVFIVANTDSACYGVDSVNRHFSILALENKHHYRPLSKALANLSKRATWQRNERNLLATARSPGLPTRLSTLSTLCLVGRS